MFKEKVAYPIVKFTLVLLHVLVVVQLAQAQFYKKADEIKNETTYVLMKNPNDPKLDEIKDAIRQGWTFTRGVEFITPQEVQQHPEAENTFMSLVSRNFYSGQGSNYPTARSYFTLTIWQCDPKYFTDGGEIQRKHIKDVVSISMSTSAKTAMANQKEIDEWNWDLSGKVYNWLPGIIKNELQNFSYQMTLDKKVANPVYQELANLKSDTLYIPEFSLITAREVLDKNPEKLFSAYKFNYKIISAEELNRKIINREKFYYATLIRGVAYSDFIVTNAITGHHIFDFTNFSSWNLKSKNIDELAKAIKKIGQP